MNEFRSEVAFPTFFFFFFFLCVNEAAPTKAKANKSKPRKLVYRVSVKINLQKKISCRKKIKYFPSFVCLLQSERERAAVLKAFITVAMIPAQILFSTQILNEYVYVDVCNNLLKHI